MIRKALFSGVTTFVMLLAIAVVFEPASTMAQPPGGGGRGQGGGRGMGGGMFGGGILQILNNEEQRAELKLTDEQIEKIQAFGKELAPEREKMMEVFGKMREASDDERAKLREETTKLTQEMTKKTDEAVSKILDEAQYKRVKQLALRAGGVRLITTDENAKALGLTDEQKEKITGILRENRGGGFGGGGGGGGQRMSREERAKQQEELQEKVTAVLTDDQKTKWKEMLGAEPAPAN
jgi:hypothetical protein